MKIKEIEIFRVKSAHILRPVGCRIHTDEGIYGDGEAALAYGNAGNAAFGMLKDLAPLIIGMNPLDNEIIWDHLYKNTYWGQNGGPVVFAGISAIDMALWDIKGKAFGVPVWQLLGGKMHPTLRSYASQLQRGWLSYRLGKSPQDCAEIAVEAVADGYDAVKFDFLELDEEGRDIGDFERTGLLSPRLSSLFESRLAAVKQAVGSGVDIIVECHGVTDTVSATQLANISQKYCVLCFEEGNTPSPKMVKDLRQRTNIPIAHGERIYSRWQFAPYFEDGSIQLAQPDLGNAGGITEVKKICDMAYVYDVGIQLHVCAGPLSTAAALQVEAAIPNFVIHEEHVLNLHPDNLALGVHTYRPEKGRYTVPDLPGLGNEWSEKALSSDEIITVKG